MNAATLKKSATDSTPGARPSASQADVEHGADTAEGGDFDIAAALGLNAEAQETETEDDKEPVDPDAEAKKDDESDDADPAAETEPEEETESGKSDDEAAQSDEADEESGESTDEEEAEPADEAEQEEGEADEAAPETEAPAKKEGFQQRINELTARAKGAEEEATSLREQNATLKAAASGELAARPLDFVDSPEQLKEAKRKLVELHAWALKNRNGGKLGDKEYDAEQVAAIEADTFTQLQTDVPDREAWLAGKAKADAAAAESYPWIKDTKAGDGQVVQQVVETYPQLRALPNYRLALANMVTAEKYRRAGIVLDDALLKRLTDDKAKRDARPGAKPGAKPAAASPKPPLRKPPAAPGRPGSLPSRNTPRASQVRSAEERMTASDGGIDDIAASIAAKLG